MNKYVLSGGVFFCALAIGGLSQSGLLKSAPAPAQPVMPQTASVLPKMSGDTKVVAVVEPAVLPAPATDLTGIEEVAAMPAAPAIVMDPEIVQELPSEPIQVAAEENIVAPEMPDEEMAPVFACDAEFSATPMAAAMVELELTSPCLGEDRVTIHHNGLMFTAVTDPTGHLKIKVPAMAETAVFIAEFTNGEGAVAQTEITSLAFYDRVAVQWKGQGGIELHALEYGADYGETGHIWAGTPSEVSNAVNGLGGFFTRLGDSESAEARMVDIYTFPTLTASQEGIIALSVEAEVTDMNCAQDVSAQTIEVLEAGAPRVRDLSLTMPDCDAVGDFLVLKNLVEDLTIARN